MTPSRTGPRFFPLVALLAGLCLPMTSVWAEEDTFAEDDAYDELGNDPWEEVNRDVYSFNMFLDRNIFKPVAKGYRWITPSFVDKGITNFFSNLNDVVVIANDVMQLKGKQALQDVGRFGVNTTVGLLGFIDVASRMGLVKHKEDFGQTLGYWGMPSGPYVMLPLLGPSNVRDAFGKIPDAFLLNPLIRVQNDKAYWGLWTLDKVDARAGLLDIEEVVTGDQYLFIRDFYQQNREFLIKDGQVEDDFLEDDFLDEDLFDEEDES